MVFWIILILILILFWYFSEFNTSRFKIGGKKYNVHNNYEPQSAAECLAEIDKRILLLQKHLILIHLKG